MNSKYRLLGLSRLVPKTSASFTNHPGKSGVMYLQSRSWHVYNKINSQSLLINFSTTNHCGCCTRSCNTPVLRSSVISRYYASTTPDTTSSGNEQPEKKPSLYQRFKMMYRDYWYVLLPVHMVTSVAWFGGFYYMASSGVDIIALLEQLNFSEKLVNPLRNGHATTGYLAISYALYKIATPLRYTVTLGGTTVSINYLKKWGYIKPIPSKEKLKEIYEGRKEMLKGKGQTLKDNMMQSLKPSENMSTATICNEGWFKSIWLKSEFKIHSLNANITRYYSTNHDGEKPIFQQMKDMVRKYWYVIIPVHLFTSMLWCVGLYFLAVSEIDVAELMERLHFNKDWIKVFRKHKSTSDFAVVYVLFHVISPLRYAVTLGGATLLKNHLKKRGIIKAQKKKDQMK